MQKSKVEDRKVLVRQGGAKGGRSCAVCCKPATKMAYRADVAGRADNSSLRLVCDDHATVEALYPARISGGENVPSFGGRGYFSREEDMFMFYREMLKGMGGQLEPIHAEATKHRKRWFAPEPLPAPRPKGRAHRTVRRARGIVSGRQWIKFRKAEGLHASTR